MYSIIAAFNIDHNYHHITLISQFIVIVYPHYCIIIIVIIIIVIIINSSIISIILNTTIPLPRTLIGLIYISFLVTER